MTQTTLILDANDPEALKKAHALLKSGNVVAFPTETVYGLGANGLDPAAVAQNERICIDYVLMKYMYVIIRYKHD